MHDRWEGRKRDLKWLIQRFWPLPGWPEDWEEQVAKAAAGELTYAG
jgi:hypothetical protein